MSGAVPLSPVQQKALNELVGAIKTKAAPLVELRSPPALARGYGVSLVLKAAASQLGAPLLSVATALEHESEGQASKALYAAAVASLTKHGMAFIDDLDLACAPRTVRRSRTLVGDIKGSGDIFNWEVASAPAMLLKALSDTAASAGGVITFSSVEDAHLAFIQAQSSATSNLGSMRHNDTSAGHAARAIHAGHPVHVASIKFHHACHSCIIIINMCDQIYHRAQKMPTLSGTIGLTNKYTYYS